MTTKPLLFAVVVVLVIIAATAGMVASRGGSRATDMNRACARHQGVFSFSADGGVCRDGTAVSP